jgi:hypothetical protein
MGSPLKIREDRSPAELRRLARREAEGRVAARLYAIANALDGTNRAEAARPAFFAPLRARRRAGA